MSKYTTELRYICETVAGLSESAGGNSFDEIISQSRTGIFDFNYPIFTTDYKPILETKILKHFYTREIGLETYGLWKIKLNTKLNEIMPYYNKLYQSELLQIEPLRNYYMHKFGDGSATLEGTVETSVEGETAGTLGGTNTNTRTFNKTNTIDRDTTDSSTTHTTEDGSNTKDNTNWDKYSDTPQGGVNGLDSDTYLTNARKLTGDEDGTYEFENSGTVSATGSVDETGRETGTIGDSGTVSQTTSGTNSQTTSGENTQNKTNEYEEEVYGYNGVSGAKLLMEYRETFLNIDMMVIEDLEELFMQLW